MKRKFSRLYLSHRNFDVTCTIGSPHFSVSEFQCPCCGKLDDLYSGVHPKLLFYLELMRSYFHDRPVVITSGCRCKKYNDSLVGSSAFSRHMEGRAADLYIKGISTDSIEKWWTDHVPAGYAYTNNTNMKGCVHVEI